MKRNAINLKLFLFALTLVFAGKNCVSQDSIKIKFQFNTTWNHTRFNFSIASLASSYAIYHNPSKEDSAVCKKYAKLINAEPTKKNHTNYYNLACSLWQLGRLKEAETMFLKIIDSKESYFVGTYYNSSDIPGDTTTNSYGYGSYTFNFKNNACQYLTKIYIEENKFDQALKYITDVENKYIEVHNCGTGYRWYRSEIDGLLSLTYEGLGMYDSIINMFLPEYYNLSSGVLIRALRKVYSQSEINEYLKVAENSIVCVVDTFQSSSFLTENYGEKNETITEIKYTSGIATMNLFGRQVTLPSPNLKEGEIVSRDFFIKEFKESEFYFTLIRND